LLFIVQQTTTQHMQIPTMHRVWFGAILQQGLSTNALENRRTQTGMQTIEKKEGKEPGEGGKQRKNAKTNKKQQTK
jgi:hypothetical protein